MQGDIDSPIFQSSLYVLSAMQGDIEFIGIKILSIKARITNTYSYFHGVHSQVEDTPLMLESILQ